MADIISKAILSGLGLASLTKDAIKKTAEDLVSQSKLSEAEGRRLVRDFQRRTARAHKTLETKVESAIHNALESLDPDALKQRLKSLKSGPKSTHKSPAKSAAKHRKSPGAGKTAG